MKMWGEIRPAWMFTDSILKDLNFFDLVEIGKTLKSNTKAQKSFKEAFLEDLSFKADDDFSIFRDSSSNVRERLKRWLELYYLAEQNSELQKRSEAIVLGIIKSSNYFSMGLGLRDLLEEMEDNHFKLPMLEKIFSDSGSFFDYEFLYNQAEGLDIQQKIFEKIVAYWDWPYILLMSKKDGYLYKKAKEMRGKK